MTAFLSALHPDDIARDREGIFLILVDEAVLLGSLPLAAYAGLLWLLFHLFVVSCEEPA